VLSSTNLEDEEDKVYPKGSNGEKIQSVKGMSEESSMSETHSLLISSTQWLIGLHFVGGERAQDRLVWGERRLMAWSLLFVGWRKQNMYPIEDGFTETHLAIDRTVLRWIDEKPRDNRSHDDLGGVYDKQDQQRIVSPVFAPAFLSSVIV